MTLSQDSSIREWLDFDGNLLNGPKPCQWYGSDGGIAESLVDVDCSRVCNSSELLLLPDTSNLVTCGQWPFLMNGWTTAPSSTYFDFNPAEALKPFVSVGLNATDVSMPPHVGNLDVQPGMEIASATAVGRGILYADLISTCLLGLYQASKAFTATSTADSVPAGCVTSHLFVSELADSEDNSLRSFLRPMTASLRSCLNAICSFATLSTDLAGIGVCIGRVKVKTLLTHDRSCRLSLSSLRLPSLPPIH